jgi:hypothetical protein
MKCPGNEDHEGIEVVKMSEKSPHYARAICRVCKAWIKWLSKDEADALQNGKNTEEPHLTAVVERMIKCFAEAEIIYANLDVGWSKGIISDIAFKLFDAEG